MDIIGVIANIFSILGVTVKDIKKHFDNKKLRNICVLILLIFIAGFYIYKKSLITVTQVTLSEDSLTMNNGESRSLIATVLYSDNSISDDVLWSSSNTSIVTVDQNGFVTALADGNATIIAQASKNNTTETAECTVAIKSPPSGYSISVHQLSTDSYAYVYVEPYDSNVTNIQIYGKSPSGEIFTPDMDENDLYHFYSECGTWTIYASVENDGGVYKAHKPEDFVTIEVTNITDTLGDSIGMFNNMFQQLVP